MFKRILLILTIALIFIFISGVSAEGDVNLTSDFDDLVNEISLSDDGVINLNNDYQFSNTSNKHIIIDKPITIDGNNHTIDAGNLTRVFWVKSDNVSIKNINFINSKTTGLAGGVISWWGNNGSLLGCNFSNNSASSAGGAVLWKGNNGIISNCNFLNNTVKYGAATSLTDGGGFDSSKPHIQVVNSEGGAVCILGNNISINYCNFYDNHAFLNGGAISIERGSNIWIFNSKFKRNVAKYNGGAIEINAFSAILNNLSFEDNSPFDVFNNCPKTEIINCNDFTSDGFYDFIVINGFDRLSELIDETPEGSTLTLDRDYTYINGTNKGILINRSITIDGNGHTLDGKKLSRMFNITADNVTLKNINFLNGNAFGRYFTRNVGGGAIYWSGANGYLEGCNFTNDTGSGVENDPFDREEEIINEDGSIIHVIRVRPMGAKINEGGAIVWNGTNGVVSNCIFKNCHVGYPNMGGAICWRGNDGCVVNSQFYDNGAWCGAAICWVGDNGNILSSKFLNGGISDQGLFWFGKNGTIKNSILLSLSDRPVLHYSGASFNADYNFWGDTLDNPYKIFKHENVTKWVVLNLTCDSDFVFKGDKFNVSFDLSNLIVNGNLTKYYGINESANITYNANATGFLNVSFANGKINVNSTSGIKIISKDLKKYYTNKKQFKVRVYDFDGKIASGKYVKITVKKHTYKIKTDENGYASLKINLKPGKYDIVTEYGDVKVRNKITIKTVLITKNVKYSKKFKVKVLNSKGKAFAKQVVKVKFRGKTYNIKTNKKGIVIFKLPKNLKAGKYSIKTTYKSLTNTNKITVKSLVHFILKSFKNY